MQPLKHFSTEMWFSFVLVYLFVLLLLVFGWLVGFNFCLGFVVIVFVLGQTILHWALCVYLLQ